MTSPWAGHSILITGGAGFLGRGILRRIEHSAPPRPRVTIFSRDEHKHHALKQQYPWVNTSLGDVCDSDRLELVTAGHDIVIHAAAMKYVPEAERDVSEAVRVNIEGSRNVAVAAIRNNVKTVVGISTDKAVSPRNTYGMTKMAMERIFQEYNRLSQTPTRLVNVRYGNVVSSTGSVVPLFRQQIAEQGRPSITSGAMTRFWISIDDAVSLIEYALINAHISPGATFVAACPAMSIEDVAKAVWQMEGKLPQDFEMSVIGTRPGEKIHELLVADFEAHYAVENHTDYFTIPQAMALAGEGSSDVMPYESSLPRHTLEIDEFIRLIEDAERV